MAASRVCLWGQVDPQCQEASTSWCMQWQKGFYGQNAVGEQQQAKCAEEYMP